jgi:carbamoyl-phosphate synthase small subunit
LRFGHRGVNQPVKNLDSGRVEITSHNHGFAVDPHGWAAEVGGLDREAGRPRGAWGWVGAGHAERGRPQPPVVETAFGRVALTHWNLNDGTLEGLRCLDIPAFSVQYHPEASPGPHDSRHLFRRFRELMA